MMKTKNWLKCIARPGVIGVVVFLLLIACVQDTGDNTNPVEDDTPYIRTEKTSEFTAKETMTGTPLIHTLWCEGAWQDPRISMGYKLEKSGKLFFDRYVMLYGGRIMNNDCVNNPIDGDGTPDSHCLYTGLHLHLPGRMYRILEERTTYIKPIQDAGIKFLLGLVPSGGGVCHGTLYSWPMEDVAPWAELYPANPKYPFGEEETQRFIDQIKLVMDKYRIDGIGFDDEYGSLSGASNTKGLGSVYPTSQYSYYSNSAASAAAWKRGGENMLRFAYELKKQIPGIVLEAYEIRYGSYIPASMEYDGKTVRMRDVISCSYESTYGGWAAESGAGNASKHMPRAQFGPGSIDLGSATAITALPPANRNGIVAKQTDVLSGKYGVNMFFSMVSRSYYSSNPQYANFFGDGQRYPERYFTMIAQTLIDKEETVVFQGQDYVLPF